MSKKSSHSKYSSYQLPPLPLPAYNSRGNRYLNVDVPQVAPTSNDGSSNSMYRGSSKLSGSVIE